MTSPPSAEGIATLSEAIRRAFREALGSGRPEAVLREHVQPVLGGILQARGARSAARNEARLIVPSDPEAAVLDAPLTTTGRADAIYNRFVIEFEPPGSLRPSVVHSATGHAVGQVQQYLRGVEHETSIPLERLAGCAFDGNWIVYVTWERGGWRTSRPRRVDLDSLAALVDTLESLSTGRGLTTTNLFEDFGRESDTARTTVATLLRALQAGDVSGRTLSMFDQWRVDLGNASGPFSTSDLVEWQTLCAALGLPSSEDSAPYVLFSLQTYFALVSKLLALIVLEGATGHRLVADLVPREGVWQGYTELESGRLTAATRAVNAIEPGLFSWYLGEHTDQLERALAQMARTAAEYSAEIVEITPLAARDVLKDLYQGLLPRSIRHRLGEYYTPDWLAQRVVNQVTGSEDRLHPSKRVLDPACGSGTFLVEVISRMLRTAAEADPSATLERIVENVVGFDLSPLAVQASKVNYLLALSPLLRYAAAPIFLRVFLADSVSPPRRGGLLEGDVYVFETSEGDWRVPVSLAESHFLPVVGTIVLEAVDGNEDAQWVRREACERLPIVQDTDYAVLNDVAGLFEKLRDLEQADRDGMWWSMLNNAFAPTLQGRSFDFVVGNPPWVSWETLPEPYRRANDRQWLHYRLRPDAPLDRRQASENVRLDLSMLFVSRCMDRYLVDDGRLGLVITSSVFRSELAGRGFRRRFLPPDTSYRFLHIDDMSELDVFDEASNQTSVLIADRRPLQRRSLPVVRWMARNSRRIPSSLELEQVDELTIRRHLYAEPVDANDPSSPLVAMPRAGLHASRPLRRRSSYHDIVREGINTRGANGVFFLEVLSEEGELVRVRNLPSKGRNPQVASIQGLVERDAVKRLLLGSDVSRGASNPSLGLLLFHDDDYVSYPLSPAEARQRFPNAFEYISQFEEILRGRGKFRNFDPSGDGWLGIYSVTTAALSEHKVVVREIAQGMIAAPVHGSDIIPDHKLYVIPCRTAREANLLADTLNCRVVDYLIRSFSISTSITGSFLRYVGVRDLSGVQPSSDPESQIARALGLSLDQYRALDAIAQTELSHAGQPPEGIVETSSD